MDERGKTMTKRSYIRSDYQKIFINLPFLIINSENTFSSIYLINSQRRENEISPRNKIISYANNVHVWPSEEVDSTDLPLWRFQARYKMILHWFSLRTFLNISLIYFRIYFHRFVNHETNDQFRAPRAHVYARLFASSFMKWKGNTLVFYWIELWQAKWCFVTENVSYFF